jgi:hypothetical protein
VKGAKKRVLSAAGRAAIAKAAKEAVGEGEGREEESRLIYFGMIRPSLL